MQFQRILYRSDAMLPGTSETAAEQMRAIVDDARVRNAAVGLTGALLLSGGVFVQALEGPPIAVERTFERICHDLRHRRVRLLELAAADVRAFGEWSMAQVTPARGLARLGPAMDVAENTRVDAASAAAIVELMRTLLLAGSVPVPSAGT